MFGTLDLDTVWFFAALLMGLLVMVAGVFLTRAQQRYLTLYKARQDSSLPAPEHITIPSPLDTIDMTSRWLRAYQEPQTDPELEDARRRVWYWWRLGLGVMIGGAAVMLTQFCYAFLR